MLLPSLASAAVVDEDADGGEDDDDEEEEVGVANADAAFAEAEPFTRLAQDRGPLAGFDEPSDVPALGVLALALVLVLALVLALVLVACCAAACPVDGADETDGDTLEGAAADCTTTDGAPAAGSETSAVISSRDARAATVFPLPPREGKLANADPSAFSPLLRFCLWEVLEASKPSGVAFEALLVLPGCCDGA